jgi:hypothetical protein
MPWRLYNIKWYDDELYDTPEACVAETTAAVSDNLSRKLFAAHDALAKRGSVVCLMLAFTLIFHAGWRSAHAAANCQSAPSLPRRPPAPAIKSDAWKGVAKPYSVRRWTGGYEHAPFGIGQLTVALGGGRDHYYDWFAYVIMPLWKAPQGRFYGWLQSSVVMPDNGASYPLTGAGMVETEYEHQTFIVWQKRQDGWLKLRTKAPSRQESGSVWTHVCHLALGEVTLSYRPWEAVIREHGEWLHFRASVPHALRSGPGVEYERKGWIGNDHDLEMLEMAGDWMRVQVREPAWHCTGPEQTFRGTLRQGWIKWRDAAKGPWVWYRTRGC